MKPVRLCSLGVLLTVLVVFLACGGEGPLAETKEAVQAKPPPQPPTTVADDPNCILSADSIQPIFGEEIALHIPRVNGRHLTESISAGPSGVLERTIGGCAHISIQFKWTGLGLLQATDDAEWPKRIAERIQATKALQADSVSTYFVEGLSQASPPTPNQQGGHIFHFPCGDAGCYLDVSPRGEDRVITVSYNFAL